MTAPVHPIPAGSPSDAPAALSSSVCVVGDDIPALAPRPDASAAPSPPGVAEAHSFSALTPHELQAFDFIRDRITGQGTAPTLAEIADELGLKARSGAHRIVEALVWHGLLIKTPDRLRGLALADAPRLFTVPTAALRAELARRERTAA